MLLADRHSGASGRSPGRPATRRNVGTRSSRHQGSRKTLPEVPRGGVEPPAFRSSIGRSYHLSYRGAPRRGVEPRSPGPEPGRLPVSRTGTAGGAERNRWHLRLSALLPGSDDQSWGLPDHFSHPTGVGGWPSWHGRRTQPPTARAGQTIAETPSCGRRRRRSRRPHNQRWRPNADRRRRCTP